MKTTHMAGMLFVIASGIILATATAQQQTPAQKHLMREDSAAVNALVIYSDTIRIDIFEACAYPSAIVSIAGLQKNSSEEFVNLISSYSKKEQEDFWNLSRYPGLIFRLAREGKRDIDAIITILRDYPEEVRVTAMTYGTKYYAVLQEMDGIQTRSDNQFEQIIADYPMVTREALRELVQFPEIVNLLNDHLGLTVRVGDRYRRDPQAVIHEADSLNLAETRQNALDAEAWKETIEQNPDEASDLINASSDYASENGYTQEEINTPPDPGYVTNYICHPYPYWFGYPTWYPYSYWYPYPFWFDCGFYYNRHGKIVIFGCPSRYFTNWYFYYPHHWRRYPHLGNTYITHYYGRRRSPGGNNSIVHRWVRERKRYLPKDFLTDKSKRTEVIREVAQLEIDVQNHEGGKQVATEVRDQYLEKHVAQYPSLDPDPKPTVDQKRPAVSEVIERPERQPAIQILRPAEALSTDSKPTSKRPSTPFDATRDPSSQPPPKKVAPSQTTDETKRETSPPAFKSDTRPQPVKQYRPQTEQVPQEPVTNPRPTSPPTYNFNKIQSAQEYQRNVWEQAQPTVRPQPQPAPRPQVQRAEPPPRPQVQQPPPPPRPQVQQPPKPAPAKPSDRSKDQ